MEPPSDKDKDKNTPSQAKKDLEAADSAVEAKATMNKVARKFFLHYKNPLSNSVQTKWSKIIASQVQAAPWTKLNGKQHMAAHKKLVWSFNDCATFQLLTIFPWDTAEKQKYYIYVHMQKPGTMTICPFVTQVKQLNS